MEVIDSITQETVEYRFVDNTHNKELTKSHQRKVIPTHTYSYKSAREFYMNSLGETMGLQDNKLYLEYAHKHCFNKRYKGIMELR